jgi:hypothetical protein
VLPAVFNKTARRSSNWAWLEYSIRGTAWRTGGERLCYPVAACCIGAAVIGLSLLVIGVL